MKKQTKYYLIYQITNNLNHKIYIGKHKTDCLDDDYFGSGKHLKNAQAKYGLENFTKTILFYCANEEEMNLLERMVVTAEFCAREDVYNIMEGGDGGWDYVNLSSDFAIGSEERRKKFHVQGGIESQKQFKETHNGVSISRYTIDNMSEEEYIEFRQTCSDSATKYWQENSDKKLIGEKNPMFGKHQTQSTIKKISEKVSGKNNGVFGKHWYKDVNELSCGMFFDDEQPDGWILGKLQKLCVSTTKGKIKIVRTDFSEAKYVFPDVAEQMIATGEWERKTKPMSVEGRKSIQESMRKPNKKHISKHEAWLKETQEMADYFTKYGYEATCKKFPGRSGTCSPESMLMRFIRARKLYGIKFESIKTGKKRQFQSSPSDV